MRARRVFPQIKFWRTSRLNNLELLHAHAPPAGEHRYVNAVQEYLEAHYAEHISLLNLSGHAGVSPFHLLRRFRKALGLTPHEYQTQLRVNRAKQVLCEGHSIVDTSFATGFVDQSHLSRHFKRIVGVTPGQYSCKSKILQDSTV